MIEGCARKSVGPTEVTVMLLEVPQYLLDFLLSLIGLPGCAGATPGSLGQFLGLVAQLLPDPSQRLTGLPQFLIKHALPLCVGSPYRAR